MEKKPTCRKERGRERVSGVCERGSMCGGGRDADEGRVRMCVCVCVCVRKASGETSQGEVQKHTQTLIHISHT